MGFLDLIFPKYCVNCKKIGDFLCVNCFSRLSFDTKNICLVCGRPSFDGLTHPRCKSTYKIEGSFTGVVFNQVSKKLIYQFKYKPYLSGLKSFIGDLLYESLIQNEEFNKILKPLQGKQVQDDIFLVPIPLSPAKYRKRGYNQAEILAKELSKKFDFPSLNLLERVKETKSQVGLDKEERKENVKGAFDINIKNKKLNLKNKNFILVDDVLTTGSTFSEACLALKHAGAGKIWALAFAKED